MKRFFIILFSTAMLISVAFFVSCGDGSSSDDGSSSGGSFAESPGTTTTRLSAPGGLTATAASSSSVEVSWYPVSSATSYQVWQNKKASITGVSYVCTATSASTIIKGLKAPRKYFFWVQAVNGTTRSGYSSDCSIYGLN